MTVSAPSLRVQFPEFADTARYPDEMINFWLSICVHLVNAGRWGVLTDQGVTLATAHHLVLASKNLAQAAVGGALGGSIGIQTSKSVDGVSVSYDVGAVTEDGAGHWNMTTYGLQYVHLARMMGAGPVYVGGPTEGAGQSLYSGAWPGPFPY